MKIALSTLGKFHSFDLARQLNSRNMLVGIWSGYPSLKLRCEELPSELVHTYPWFHGPYMINGLRRAVGPSMTRHWEYLDRVMFDRHVAGRFPSCDLFVGLSGGALATGRVAKSKGVKYICDRGSTHIANQDAVMREEHERWGIPFSGIDSRIISREQAEYSEADLITVPSTAARRSFIDRGFSPHKVALLPYGVELQSFHPVGQPPKDSFDLLFVGGVNLRKGIPYLLEAFGAISHPRKSLTIAGSVEPELVNVMRIKGLLSDDVKFVGHVPQTKLKALMSESHLLVLPSVEEGLALVMAQALACGCPVLATEPTGAADLYTDGIEGFIVEPRDSILLAERIQKLIDDADLAKNMRLAAVSRVASFGGWSEYGRKAEFLYRELCA